MPPFSESGERDRLRPSPALHTFIGLPTDDSTRGASGCADRAVVNRARSQSRPSGFHPFCNPTSPVKLGPFFDPHPDIRRLLRSRPSHNPTVVRLPDSNGPGQPSRDCGAAVAHIVCAVGGARTLPWHPSKNKIGLPNLRSRTRCQIGRSPSDFLLAPPHPVSPTGRGSCADFAQNP
jgi:hypothetical protein